MKLFCIINQNIFRVNSGGGQCAFRNYEALQKMVGSERLYTCIISPDYDVLERKGNELYVPGLKNNIESAIVAVHGDKCCKHHYLKKIWEFMEAVNPDMVYLDTSKLGLLSKKIKTKYQKKVICFFHNIEADYSYNLVKSKGKQYVLSCWASKRNERSVIQYADALLCLTRRDADRMRELYGRGSDKIIPITFRDVYDAKKNKVQQGKGILFVGSCFPPNYDGMKWFVDNVMGKLPNITLTIVGKGFETKKSELQRKNVIVIGTVKCLEEFYYAYPLVVMPIRYGSGMKVKTAEAMMYGRMILASDEALEGYDVDGVKGIYRCNTADEYVARINEVFENGEPEPYQAEVRKLFLAKYDTKQIENEFEQVVKSVLMKA